MAYAPSPEPRAAASSSPSLRLASVPPPSSDSLLPSSPTPSSCYQPSPRPAPRPYKPTTSARRRVSGPGSGRAPASASAAGGPSASLRAAQENARRARTRTRTRILGPGEGAPDAPGGWGPDGEWQEWDDDELVRLEHEVRKDRRRWEYDMRRREELAREEGRLVDPELDPVDEVEWDDGPAEMLAPEPPDDILFDDDDATCPSPALYPPYSRRLPSLTSAPGSSASSCVDYLSDGDLDLAADREGALDSDMDVLPADGDPHASAWSDLATFSAAVLASPCPAGCGATAPASTTLALSDPLGLVCTVCRWSIPAAVLDPLARAFVAHGSASQGHAPLLSWTRFTGTVIFCAAPGCDEQFAA